MGASFTGFPATSSASAGVNMFSAKKTGLDWGGIAEAGIPLALSLFAGHGIDTAPTLKKLSNQVDVLGATAKDQFAAGQSNLDPVLKYLKAVTSNDPAQVQAATEPERTRIMDQYDTARRSAATFAPRGGGQTSSFTNSRMAEARDLAQLPAQARSAAMGQLATIGTAQQQQGVTLQEQATNALADLFRQMQTQKEQEYGSTLKTFAGIGKLIASFIPGGSAVTALASMKG